MLLVIIRVITLELTQPTWPQYINVMEGTDRQTDRPTNYDSNASSSKNHR